MGKIGCLGTQWQYSNSGVEGGLGVGTVESVRWWVARPF